VDKDTFFNGLEGLFARGSGGMTERHLSNQLPVAGDVPLLLDHTIDQGGVMLKGAAQTFSFQSSPNGVLDHTRRLFRPSGEVLSVQGELFLLGLDVVLVFEEQDSTVARSEAVHLGVGGTEFISRDDTSENFTSSVPEFVVFLAQQDLGSSTLNVERTGNVLDAELDDFLDSGIRDLDVLGLAVDGTSLLDSIEEGAGISGVVESRVVLGGHVEDGGLGEVKSESVFKMREHFRRGC